MKVGTFPTKLYFEYEAREKIATNKEKRELSSTSDVKHEGKIRSRCELRVIKYLPKSEDNG